MDLLNIALTSIGSIIVLFLLTKLIGNRQMSELNMFDYINGITIGSIAAEMATSLEGDFLKPLLAMIIYGVITVLISILANKNIKLRRFFNGKTLILYKNNKLFYKNFKKARIDINEFLSQLRINGYFNLSELEAVFLEENGKISALPKSESRPLIPKDIALFPDKDEPLITLVIDGKVLTGNLKFSGKDITWLNKKLKEQNINRISDVFLAVCDSNDKITSYKKIKNKPDRDMFQ